MQLPAKLLWLCKCSQSCEVAAMRDIHVCCHVILTYAEP